jgi:putative aminopeptidase FrvX
MKFVALVAFLLISAAQSRFSPLNHFQPSTDVPVIDRDRLLRDVQILSSDDMEGRRVDSTGGTKARTYVLQRFKQSGIEPFGSTYEQPFTFPLPKDEAVLNGVNIIGLIPGSSERMIVLTAHYDHLGMLNGQIYNGADDNASGVAALFAIGTHFRKHPPQNTLMIAALDAEERGARGGEKLVKALNKQKIIMNINMDMIGRDKNNILFAAGTHHYPHLKPYLERVAAKSDVKLLFGHDKPYLKNVEDWTKDSDHYAFHRNGIPFIYFGVEDYEHHHKPTDDFETLTHDFYAHAVGTIIMALEEFDRSLK